MFNHIVKRYRINDDTELSISTYELNSDTMSEVLGGAYVSSVAIVRRDSNGWGLDNDTVRDGYRPSVDERDKWIQQAVREVVTAESGNCPPTFLNDNYLGVHHLGRTRKEE